MNKDISSNSNRRTISIDKAYKMAINAFEKQEMEKADSLVSIISRSIKKDGKKGFFSGEVEFVGAEKSLLKDKTTSFGKNI